MVSAHRSATPSSGTPKPGLRERKKLQTREAIRHAAYRLFAERGYDATPVDRIAEAAEVSPSTVFRYFPTKEDIVLADDRHAVLEAGLRARPLDEPVVESMRRITVEALRRLTAQERGELIQRVRLIREVPAVRGRTAEKTARDAARLTAVLAERSGRPEGDPELRVTVAALLAALQEALLTWVESGPEGDPTGPVHRAMDVLARGLTP
ncbi:TetR/AcrR family transcriptional regulator [Streptomyces kronopolitis]|uniref:TetR/AcrR family transcriptional regulator n=1 Tax=Streptomyces kronopolitis TaxID=1612435 RepID=UPI0034417F52